MNILEVTTFLRGGAGVFLTRLSCNLVKRGHNVDVVSSGHVDNIIDWDSLIKDLDKFDIKHYNLNVFKRENELFWFEAQKLAKLLQENKYDIIHVHAGVPALAVYVAKELVQIEVPVLATFHSWSKNRPEWMDIADAWAFNKCNKVIFDSYEYMNIGKSKGIIANMDVIYPGLLVDIEENKKDPIKIRKELCAKFNISNDSIIITNVAEITERKGQIDLVKTLEHILAYRDDVYLFLIGESREKQYYKKLIREIRNLGLGNKVYLLGWIEDPYKIVSVSDLFIFSSYSEGLGLAIIEAIILGVPTIFSSIEGTKDIENILRDTCLGTFEPGDYKRAGELALKILKQDKIQISNKVQLSANKVKSVFDFDKIVSRYENEMSRLIENKVK